MTEVEWRTCTDPVPMERFLTDKISHRKLRLSALACCRTVWTLLSPFQKEAVQLAENYVDGHATVAELAVMVTAVNKTRLQRSPLHRAVYDAVRSKGGYAGVAWDVARTVARQAAPNPSFNSRTTFVNGQILTEQIPPNSDRLLWDKIYAMHLNKEVELLRDIIGPTPFRPIGVAKEVLSESVVAQASRIYERRAFDQLSELAQALQKAGCRDDEVLDHCRRPGAHARGCWVVDLLLGRS